MRRLLTLAFLIAVAAPATLAAQRVSGAFVVMLGTDTVAVERYMYDGSRIEGDLVVRSPFTAHRRYVATLGPRQEVRRLTYESRRVGSDAPPVRAELDFDSEGASMRMITAARDTTLRIASRGSFPYLGSSYALIEQAFRHARQLAPADSFVFPMVFVGSPEPVPAVIRRAGSDSMTFAIFEPLTFRGHVDAQGRLTGIHVPGPGQSMQRVHDVDVNAIAQAWAREDAAGRAMGPLSPLDSVQATIGGANVAVIYSRPSIRGRQLRGSLIPLGTPWRTGANTATELRTSTDIEIGGTRVPAGSYSLFTIIHADGRAELVINRQAGMSGTEYDATRDFARVPAVVRTISPAVERLTFAVEPSPMGGTLRWTWGDIGVEVPIRVR